MRILVVITASNGWITSKGAKQRSGFWAQELTEAYRVFKEAGCSIDFATPLGGHCVPDPASLTAAVLGARGDVQAVRSRLHLLEPFLSSALALERVDAGAYDAFFFVGGYAAREDFAVFAPVGQMVRKAHEAGAVIGAVSHGQFALVTAKDLHGHWVFEGAHLTAMSNAEERLMGRAERSPWLLQDRLLQLGAHYEMGKHPFGDFVVRDGNLITGESHNSAGTVARKILGIF